ncbi:MAG TPA: metallophosphoesterase [Bacilli bacterium]|nr:metallophosphoesterase [Bacilli bacterium]
MNLLVLSDLHIDYNDRRVEQSILPAIAAYIREVAPDRVIIAGDMSGGAERCIRCLEEIEQRTGVPLSYIPGNHSIWRTSKETDSWHEYNRLRDHHTSLIDRPLVLNDEWVLLGDMGWYDYTFREPHRSVEDVIGDRNRVWNDSVMARWDMTDAEVCDLMLQKFERQIEAHADKQMIFVNHFIPYPDFVPVSTRSEIWNLIRPFMGSARLGDLLDRYEQVRYVIFGHMHYRYGEQEHRGKQIVCAPLGYVKKEWKTDSIEQELRDCGVVIRI